MHASKQLVNSKKLGPLKGTKKSNVTVKTFIMFQKISVLIMLFFWTFYSLINPNIIYHHFHKMITNDIDNKNIFLTTKSAFYVIGYIVIYFTILLFLKTFKNVMTLNKLIK